VPRGQGGADVLHREGAVEIAEHREVAHAWDAQQAPGARRQRNPAVRAHADAAGRERQRVPPLGRGELAHRVARVQQRRDRVAAVARQRAPGNLLGQQVRHAYDARQPGGVDRAPRAQRRPEQRALGVAEPHEVVREDDDTAGRDDRRHERAALVGREARVARAHEQAVRIVRPQATVHPRARQRAAQRAAGRGQGLLDAGDAQARVGQPVRRDVGSDAHRVHHADRGAERAAAAEQQRLLAGARADRLQAAAQARRATERRIGGAGGEPQRVEEVELQVLEAHGGERREELLEVRQHLGPARIQHVDRGVRAPGRVQQTAQQLARAVRRAQPPVRMLGEELALADAAEGRGPQARREARRTDRLGERREAARELRAGREPVADGALIAVVELHDVDGQLVARRDERIEVAQHVVLADVVERVVPAAPSRDEGARDARADAPAVVVGVGLEQRARVVAELDAHGLELDLGPRRELGVDAPLHLDLDRVAVAPRVELRERAPLLLDADAADGARGAADRDHQVRLVPAVAVRGQHARRVVEPAQPGTGGKGGLALEVERSRAGVGPRLPAVLQVADDRQLALAPAERQQRGLELQRLRALVADAHARACQIAARLPRDVERERAVSRAPALEGEARGPAVVRSGRLGGAEPERGRRDAARPSAGDRGGSGHCARSIRRMESQRGAFEARLRDGSLLVLDGATGTELERRGVPSALPLWSAPALIDHPDVVRRIHADYADAGAEVITANTFRTQARTLARGGLAQRAAALTRRAVELAREGARAGRGHVFVVGSAPTLEDCYRPDLVPDAAALAREHAEHARHLAAAGVDAILVETMNSVREAVAATRAARAQGVAALVSFVCWDGARLLSGEPLEDAALAARDAGADAVLVNCLPPTHVPVCLPALARTGLPFGAYANLGAPNDETGFTRSDDCTPEEFAAHALRFAEAGARIVGGCCGTTPAHLRAVAHRLRGRPASAE
jgi:S-methylmethionine-dependent homocysteine/selenocysteine methylase